MPHKKAAKMPAGKAAPKKAAAKKKKRSPCFRKQDYKHILSQLTNYDWLKPPPNDLKLTNEQMHKLVLHLTKMDYSKKEALEEMHDYMLKNRLDDYGPR